MISDHEVLHLVIETYPKSRDHLVAGVEYWLPEKGPITPHSILSQISGLVRDNFLSGDYDQAEELFDLIERFITDGSENVANAACTCFIENLQNYCGIDGFDGSYFTPLLGPESLKYARAWDKFTGVKTKGI
jgi:hypothetical protein